MFTESFRFATSFRIWNQVRSLVTSRLQNYVEMIIKDKRQYFRRKHDFELK